jgi:hypothetical protein
MVELHLLRAPDSGHAFHVCKNVDFQCLGTSAKRVYSFGFSAVTVNGDPDRFIAGAGAFLPPSSITYLLKADHI